MIKSVENMAGRLSNLWPWKRINNENNTAANMSTQDNINRAIGRYEAMFFKIQSLLIWENPVLSTIFVIGVNLLYWVVITLQFRFYSMACLTMLFVFVYNLWVEEIWPEIRVPPTDTPDSEDWTPIHPSVLSVPEISHYLQRAQTLSSTAYEKAKALRQEQPGLFCGVCCGILSVIWIIGRAVPGVWLLYLTVNAILLLPGVCIHLLPPNTLSSISEASKNLHTMVFPQPSDSRSGESLEAELILEESPETMALLSMSLASCGSVPLEDEEELASLLPAQDILMADDNGDPSTFNSLTPALGAMPSHEDESLDGLEFIAADLEPSQTADDGIRFRNRHFNGNDSSDEDSLGQGLSFPDPGPEPSLISNPITELLNRAAIQSVASSMAQTLAGAVSGITSLSGVQAAPPVPQKQESDEDEDFEIINQEDLPNMS